VIFSIKTFKGLSGILLAVAGATAIVQVFDLETRAHVSVLGPLPLGPPAFSIPWVGVQDLTTVAVGGLAAALVSFADTSVLSRSYAARLGQAVDPNQEMIGLGVANLAAGFFQGFPISSSSSRTPVKEAAGSRTQLTEVTDLRRLYRIQRWEFWLAIVCFAGVVVFGAIPDIGLAVVIAVIKFLWDGWRPHSAVLGSVESVRGYHDITRYPQARQMAGLLLFRWDAALFFANTELFKERVLDSTASSATNVK
jgi:MFS superfamily sulfate permease-like transporter